MNLPGLVMVEYQHPLATARGSVHRAVLKYPVARVVRIESKAGTL
jgi:hypothetical protein